MSWPPFDSTTLTAADRIARALSWLPPDCSVTATRMVRDMTALKRVYDEALAMFRQSVHAENWGEPGDCAHDLFNMEDVDFTPNQLNAMQRMLALEELFMGLGSMGDVVTEQLERLAKEKDE